MESGVAAVGFILEDNGRLSSAAGAVLEVIINRVWLIIFMVVLGCAPALIRPHETTEQLLTKRKQDDVFRDQERHELVTRNLERVKKEEDDYLAGRTKSPPVMDILVISGGGDWGAFGAGVLKGWGKAKGDLTRPAEFDAVTGVSTGALIAPFAFLGDEHSIDEIEDFYRHPQPDWFVPRGILEFLLTGKSYAQIPGLEKELSQAIDTNMLHRLADTQPTGRVLMVSATSVDLQEMHLWDLAAEAQRALDTHDSNRIRQILLASSAVPGAFPPRMVDGELFMDGGISGNIFYGERALSRDSFLVSSQAKYPNTPPPRVRYWVIFNNEFRPAPEQAPPLWPNMLSKAATTATREATINAIRLLFYGAKIARLEHRDQMEVRVIAIPDNWVPPRPGFFDAKTMNELADMGERMGADSSCWRAESP